MYIIRQLSGDETRGVESLTLDAVKSGIRFQKSVAEAWIKVGNIQAHINVLTVHLYIKLCRLKLKLKGSKL